MTQRCGSTLLAVLLLAAPAAAQETKPPFGEGSHALRVLLHRAHLAPITSAEELREELNSHPERILIISLGRQDWLARLPLGLRAFHAQGGAFLGASDNFTQVWSVPYRVEVGFSFVRIESTSKHAYRGSADCPVVMPEPDADCPVFEGLSRVATNRPGYLALGNRAPGIAGRFPVGCFTVNGDATPIYFAAGGPIGNGRVLLMADHSVFINDMMLPTDNDNFDMARTAIAWLTENGKRDRVYFMEDGHLVTDFNVPVKELPTPSVGELLMAAFENEAALTRHADAVAVNLERGYDRNLIGLAPLPLLLRSLLIALTTLLIVFGLWALIRARHQLDPQIPLLTPALSGVAPTEAVLTQRQRAALADGNLWEAAHGLARQFFDTALPGATAAKVPRVGGTGTPAQHRSWRKQVGRLWRLAHAATPWRVSAKQFEGLTTEIDTLKAALASGLLTLSA
jgi:hypothetical protein